MTLEWLFSVHTGSLHCPKSTVRKLMQQSPITDAPLLRWNDIPSLLTSGDEIVATYFPVRDDENWPNLAVQAHPFGTDLAIKPARDRYYFQQNKVVGFL